jgi:spermidine synthase
MMEAAASRREASAEASRYLPVLVVLFAASGCSALIYEIVWYQLLQLAIGSTAVSLGILVATYMGGLCLGSAGLARVGLERRHPLRVYAALEFGIAALALLVLAGLPLVERVYFAGARHGLAGMLLRGAVCALCLLPPTILMGASLPALARWVRSTPAGVAWWGFLYGGNTLGAVLGCLLAGFWLLRLHDTVVASFWAAGLNVLVGVVSLWLARRTPAEASDASRAEPEPAVAEGAPARAVYVAIAISGATALAGEVVWTRLLGMLFGATVYVFSIILAVFLAGMALGSGGASLLLRVVRGRSAAAQALGWCQALLAAGIFWAAWMIASSLPYWPVNPFLASTPWFTFQIDMARALWAILPPAILWGASFPLALAAARRSGGDPARVVGAVYAANTLGAIAGALAASLLLVPLIGSRDTQRLLVLLAASSALVVLAPAAWRSRSKAAAAALLLMAVAAGWMASGIRTVPGELIAYGRRIAVYAGRSTILETSEGRNSSLAISRWNDGAIELDVNGHVEATTELYDMRLQRTVGHLPALLHPGPVSVLGIGFGAGVSAGTFTRYPSIRHITVCEIEPRIPPTSHRYFAAQNYGVACDPRTRIVFDDARHYLLTTDETFDIIASDPLDVFVKGTAALYSREYFEAVKRRLNPGGLFTLYVPLYETDVPTIKSELATFFEAFPHGTIWANTVEGRGYDMVFLGPAGPMTIDLDAVEERLSRPGYAPVVRSLGEIGVHSPLELFASYAGRERDLGEWVRGADINRDRDLRLEYLAGWGINSALEDILYRQMISYRRMPGDLFTGSPARVRAVLDAIASGSYAP